MNPESLSEKLDALIASGMTYKSVAASAQCDTSTIFRIRSGSISNPSYSVGTAIDALYASMIKSAKAKKSSA